MKTSKARPSSKVICRILGFPEAQCDVETRLHVEFDPIVSERLVEGFKTHPGWPDDPLSWNVFFSYKKPMSEEEGHLNFPKNFNLDEACVLAVFNKMSETERQELRDRSLDKNLQGTLSKIRSAGNQAFIGGDRTRANEAEKIAAVLAEWRAAR